MKMITSNQSPTLELPRAVNRSPSKMISGTNTTAQEEARAQQIDEGQPEGCLSQEGSPGPAAALR